MEMALFVRTYWKDLDWLALCLRSIERHCREFCETVVAVPESTRPWMAQRVLPRGVRLVYGPVYADDYLGQQATKLHADLVTAAAFIAHVDADCIFVRETRPQDLALQGRPRLATRPNIELGRHYPWRGPTERFLGFAVDLDFMRRPPFVYPRWIYARLREHCETAHGVALDRYVAGRPPRGFSEFNALGAFAHRFHGGQFEFVDEHSGDLPPPCCDWHWSWGGITHEVRRRIDAALGADAT
jgi:hypothetical protein